MQNYNNQKSNNRRVNWHSSSSYKNDQSTVLSTCGSKQRAQDRFQMELERDGLVIKYIRGDGSCMYHAIADQLEQVKGGNFDYYQDVKRPILQYIKNNATEYAQYVENNDIQGYLQNKWRAGTWGDIIELKVAAIIFEVNVQVYDNGDKSWGIKLFEGDDVKTIFLSYHGSSHYNSLRKRTRDTTANSSQPILGKQQLSTPEQQQKELSKQLFLEELRRQQLTIVNVLVSGNRLYHAIADQLEQIFPGKGYNHKIVENAVKNHVKNNKRENADKVKDADKHQKKGAPYTNENKDELNAVALFFQVNIKVLCTDQPSYVIESPNSSDQWIYLSYHDNSYYSSLAKIMDVPCQQQQYSKDAPSKQTEKIQDSESHNVSRLPLQQHSQNFEMNFQEFKNCMQRNEIVPIEVTQEGSGFFHSIADQLQCCSLEGKWQNIQYDAVRSSISQHILENHTKYGSLLNYNFPEYLDNLSRSSFEVTNLQFHIVSHTFEVNIVVYSQQESTPYIYSDFPEKPDTIYLTYDGALFKSLRKRKQKEEEQKKDVNVGKSGP